jgi:hypothetical protein
VSVWGENAVSTGADVLQVEQYDRTPDGWEAAMTDAVNQLRRWEDSGAIWRVLSRAGDGVEIALLTCDAGEEVARLRSTDPDVLAYVQDRDRSDRQGAAPPPGNTSVADTT